MALLTEEKSYGVSFLSFSKFLVKMTEKFQRKENVVRYK